MTIFEATQLSDIMGNSGFTALVDDRVYPGSLPTDPVIPAVTYELISSPRSQTQQGAKLTRPRYRWNCWGNTYDESIAVAQALMKALAGNGRWIDDEGDHRESTTGLFRRRIESLKWIDAPEAAP